MKGLNLKMCFIALILSISCTSVQAQFLKKLKNTLENGKDKIETKSSPSPATSTPTTTSPKKSLTAIGQNSNSNNVSNGKTYYVSLTGSNRNTGDKASPIKDLQKAINIAQNGDKILVAEGNYLGTLDQGFIEIKNKYISIIGGYSSDFSERNPAKYITSIRPGHDQAGTCGSRGSLHLDIKGNPNGNILIDGIVVDRGNLNEYCKAMVDEPITSTPNNGVETGRIVFPTGKPSGQYLIPGGFTPSEPLLRGRIEGNITVRNCVFSNCGNYGIMIAVSPVGHVVIDNNLFVANLYAACQVTGNAVQQDQCHIDFTNNTVLFSWCRTKTMEDMGYGFRYMTGINANVRNNIFGGSNLAALDRGYVSSDANIEAKRVTNATDNIFFMNKADIALPSGGGKWLMVPAEKFEDVEQLKEYEGNKQLPATETAFVQAINQSYLQGFATIAIANKSNFDRNSAANQLNVLFGHNMTGSETVRPTMFANRYPYNEIFLLWGKVAGYGAQMPK